MAVECATCLRWSEGAHSCPPRWNVQCGFEQASVYAETPEEAAIAAAHIFDRANAYRIALGDLTPCFDVARDGVVSRFYIEGWADIDYAATRVPL